MSVRSDWPAFAGIDWGGEHCQRGDAGRWDWHLCMLDGSLVGVEFDKDPKVSKLSRAWERTRHWPVDPAANTTPSARVVSDARWWVGTNRLGVWAIGPVLAMDLSGRTGGCTAAQ